MPELATPSGTTTSLLFGRPCAYFLRIARSCGTVRFSQQHRPWSLHSASAQQLYASKPISDTSNGRWKVPAVIPLTADCVTTTAMSIVGALAWRAETTLAQTRRHPTRVLLAEARRLDTGTLLASSSARMQSN